MASHLPMPMTILLSKCIPPIQFQDYEFVLSVTLTSPLSVIAPTWDKFIQHDIDTHRHYSTSFPDEYADCMLKVHDIFSGISFLIPSDGFDTTTFHLFFTKYVLNKDQILNLLQDYEFDLKYTKDMNDDIIHFISDITLPKSHITMKSTHQHFKVYFIIKAKTDLFSYASVSDITDNICSIPLNLYDVFHINADVSFDYY